MTTPEKSRDARLSGAELLVLAVAAGLANGVVETAFKVAQRSAFGTQLHVSPHVVWMAPVADLLLALTIAVGVFAVARLRGRPIRPVPAIAALSFPLVLGLCLQVPGLHVVAALVLALGGAKLLADRAAGPVARSPVMMRRLAGGLSMAVLIAGLAVAARDVVRNRATPDGPADAGRPNVLLLVLDTVRATSMSLYGYGLPTTPGVEELARTGVTFEQAWTTSPWTLPSHASMFTGRWDHELAVDLLTPLEEGMPTLAEVLAAENYETAGFAANLLYTTYEMGLDRGFRQYSDYPISPGMVISSAWVPQRIARRVRPILGLDDDLVRRRADDINGDFINWLDSRRGDNPFFAFLNYYDAHGPRLPPDSLGGRFGPSRTHEVIGDMSEREFWSPRELAAELAAYDATIAFLDGELRSLFKELEERGLLENTVLVITSDHGEQMGEHGLTDHGNSLYRQNLHVPLVIRRPGGEPAPVRIAAPVSLRDLPATILHLVGVDEHPIPGTPLAAVSEGVTEPASPLLSEVRAGVRPRQWLPIARGPMQSLRSGDWHLIRNGDGAIELYDVGASGEAETDVAGTRADIRDPLERELRRLIDDSRPR